MRYDKKADPFYLSRGWRRLRLDALQRDHYLCQRCGRRAATVVHHIIPVRERPDLKRELSNLECVCDACHNALHPERNRRAAAATEDAGVRVIDLGGMYGKQAGKG